MTVEKCTFLAAESSKGLHQQESKVEYSEFERENFSKGILFLLGDGYEFEKEKLVQLWMALGYIPDEDMEIKGAAYFYKLLYERYILVSESKSMYKVNAEKFEMIRNKSEYLILKSQNQGSVEKPNEILHVSVVLDGTNSNAIFETLQKFKNSMTLLFHGTCGPTLDQLSSDLYLSFKSLSALDLSGADIKELPSFVVKMSQLRYLDVSWTLIKYLPEAVSCLKRLQTLRLKGCSLIRRLPRDMRMLTELRHLEFDILGQLTVMPKGLGVLTKLRTLSSFIVGTEEGFDIKELRDLNNMSGEFCIVRLENVKCAEDAKCASMRSKSFLKKLDLRWSDFTSRELEKEVSNSRMLYYLCPHSDLEELLIRCYADRYLPSWIGDKSFQKLARITLFKCKNVIILPSIKFLPSVKYLELVSLSSVIKVDVRGEIGHVAFPKLQTLIVDEMLKVTTWTEAKEGDFPCLIELTISNCPNLSEFPSLLYLTSLKSLEMSSCPKVKFLPGEKLSSSLENLIVDDCPLFVESCWEKQWELIKHVANKNVWIDQEAIFEEIDSESDSVGVRDDDSIKDASTDYSKGGLHHQKIDVMDEASKYSDPSDETQTSKMAVLWDPSPWLPKNSAEVYNIENWGRPYFTFNSSGNISVRPYGDDTEASQEIDILKVVNEASRLGLRLPLIIRFADILKHRVESLQSAFDSAIQIKGYKSSYQGVYPVKSNQDRFIVEDIVNFGASSGFGLESGSKPELLLAMSCLSQREVGDKAFLICKGFKDPEYIRLAFIAQKLRLNVVIVLELESELDLIINLSRKLDIKPVIGVRAKLQTKHKGHFGSTEKFGLSASQIYGIVEKLKNEKMLGCLQVLHFHIGSQIPTKRKLHQGVTEGAKIYSELVELGAPMSMIDVGGGLGVNYDGSKSTCTDSGTDSIEYTVEEYAEVVVDAIYSVCDRESVEHPIICSESGRAIVSHHSVLIFEAFSSTVQSDTSVEHPTSDTPSVSHSNSVTTYNVNLSVFTLIPNFWGIEHLFPIIPIHRLNEKPDVPGVLSDITCDGDGLINKFIGGNESLMLHELDGSERYYLGMFLGGAYQEALGGHHNLFGRPNVVRVLHEEGEPDNFTITNTTLGLSCKAILQVMQHDPTLMFQTLQQRAGNQIDNDDNDDAIDYISRAFENMPYLNMW